MHKNQFLPIEKLSEHLLFQVKLETELRDQLASMSTYLQKISSTLDAVRHSGSEINFDDLEAKQYLDALLKQISTMRLVSSKLENKETSLHERGQGLVEFLRHKENELNKMLEFVDVLNNGLKPFADTFSELQRQFASISVGLDRAYSAISKFLIAVEKIKAQNENIKKVFEVVNETVAKTNLLAINTAIIADKATAKADGLKVIAKEMQILAEQSKYSAAELAAIIASFMTEVNETENILSFARASHEQDLLIAKNCEAIFVRLNKVLSNLIENVVQLKERINLGKDSISSCSQSLHALISDIEFVGRAGEEYGLTVDGMAVQSQKILEAVQMSHRLFEKHMQLINQTITEASDAANLATQSMSKCGQLSQNALVFEGLLHDLVDGQEPQA